MIDAEAPGAGLGGAEGGDGAADQVAPFLAQAGLVGFGGGELDKRRDQLRATLPIRRAVGPADVAALAVHTMTNTALTGATYDIDGGEQILPGSGG